MQRRVLPCSLIPEYSCQWLTRTTPEQIVSPYRFYENSSTDERRFRFRIEFITPVLHPSQIP